MKLISNNLFKKRRAFYALLFFVLIFETGAQTISNLVNNGSFEIVNSCPSSLNIDNVYNCKYWFKPTFHGSSDYFNSCSTNTTLSTPTNFVGTQIPFKGSSYGGIITYISSIIPYNNYREYLEVGLIQTLQIGKKYCISFNVSLAENTSRATANIGFYLSKDSIIDRTLPFSSTILTYSPIYETAAIISDTINWTKIETSYLSTGNQNFITIGNFRNDLTTMVLNTKPTTTTNLAYYYIDDVSIVEINTANAAIKDSLISSCFMDSVQLGTDSTEFATYTWNSTPSGIAALSCTNCPNPIAKPLVTTKYYLTKQQCSAITIDSVTVVVLTPTTQANAGNDKTICLGDVVQIGTQDSLAFTNYTWQNATTLSCTNCAMPFANPNVTTTYTVQRTECANITTDTIKIIIDDCDPTFVLPNVFTPNGDEINDTWGVNFSTVNSHITNFKMSIYDRWGLLVYSTNYELSTPNSKWDGRTTAGIECNAGVYFYVITFSKNEEQQKLSGHLSLFR